MNKQPIGVFDSGIGGLTVLDKIIEIMPNEDYIYVADQGHCPYGTKKEEEIIECVLNVGKYLIAKNVKAIVIACNTASLFIKYLREIVDIPVISVIEPTCEYAMKVSKNKRIAVLATDTTIRKAKYQNMLKDKGYEAFGVPCQDFVTFVETKELDDPEGEKIVRRYLTPLVDKDVDTVIHGCTHFSLLEDNMRKVLGDKNYVACGLPTAQALKEILTKSNSLNDENHHGYVKIYTTGKVENAKENMKWFKKNHEEIKHIDVEGK